MSNWRIDPHTDKQWKPIIVGLHDLIYNSKDVISSLPDFEQTKDLGVIDYTVTGEARKVEVTYNGIKYVLYIHFYNRDNGNCLAVTNEANGRNLLQLVLDNYLEKTPFGARLWHDGKITGIANLTSEKLINYIKGKAPDLIKHETGYGDYVEFGYINEKEKLSFANSRVLKLLSNLLLFSILRHEIKKEFKAEDVEEDDSISESDRKFLLVNITWSSKDWQEPSEDKSGHKYVSSGNVPHESWNFDFDNSRNTEDLIYGFGQFTNPPKVEGDNNLLIFYSQNQIVGFYGKAEVLPESVEVNKRESYNLIGSRPLSVLLKNKISDVKEKGYLEDKQRVGQIGFTYLQKKETIEKILAEAISLNPTEAQVLYKIKDWINDMTYKEITIEYPTSFATHGQFQKNFFNELEIPNTVRKVNVRFNGFEYEDLTIGQEGSGRGRIYFPNNGVKFVSDNPNLQGGQRITISVGWRIQNLNKTYSPDEIREMFKAFLENKVPDSCNIYLSSIDNRVHGWAIKHGFVNESIYEKYIPSEVDDMFDQLQELEDVKVNNNTFYTPMNWYRKFCRALEAGNLNNSSQENSSNLNDMETNNVHPLNQILFGPPGTGKTYNTISEAIKIVDNKFYEENSDDRNSLQKRFNDLLIKEWKNTNGQIAFCTFHQSFSYEDFVEGIKPKATDDKQVYYEIEDGIFKSICRHADATNNAQILAKENLVAFTQEEYNQAVFYKVSLGDTSKAEGKEVYDYCISNNVISIGFGEGIDFTGKDEEQVNELVKDNNLEAYSAQAINHFKNYLQVGNYVIISNGNLYIRALGKVTGEYKFEEETGIGHNHFRSVEWIFKDVEIPVNEFYEKNLSQQTIYKLKKEFIIPTFFVKAEKQAEVKTEPKNFVIIIDEINRGNVSSIFGELITLVEPTKRAGRPEALEVVLPYSKKRFTVPSNVFIIGTMNTADRSIESLDTALRRRFSFTEMSPKSDLIRTEGKSKGVIEGIDLIKLLDKINDRIEKLIDKDHKIGHSYFISIDSMKGLQLAFKDKVIPLLEEYFFGDFGKIGLVLGNSFVKKEVSEFEFAKFEEYDSQTEQDLKQRAVYLIKPVEDWDFKSVYEART
jgi:hypothetical protein